MVETIISHENVLKTVAKKVSNFLEEKLLYF